MTLTYNVMKENALNIIDGLLINELQKKFPLNLFLKYKDTISKIAKVELLPLYLEIISKNEKDLESKANQLLNSQSSDDSKQYEFNTYLNGMFNMFGKIKMTQKAYIVQKNVINFIKYTEKQYSKDKKKMIKEQEELQRLQKLYQI